MHLTGVWDKSACLHVHIEQHQYDISRFNALEILENLQLFCGGR